MTNIERAGWKKENYDLGGVLSVWEERLWARLAKKRVFHSAQQEEDLDGRAEESVDSMNLQ